MRRRLIAGSFALLLALVSGSGLALAGGWAVTSVEGVPGEIEAGKTYTLTYTVRQHGEKPVDVDNTFISARTTTGETATFQGRPTGQIGVYTAEVTFPTAAEWSWEVEQGWFGTQSLGNLQVVEASGAGGSSSSLWTSDLARVALPAGALALVALFVLQGAFFLRGRHEPRPVETIVPAGQAGD